MRGTSAVKELFGSLSPGEFFDALSVLDAAEPGGMSLQYGANSKTGRGCRLLGDYVLDHPKALGT
jgi:hypothetical protein